METFVTLQILGKNGLKKNAVANAVNCVSYLIFHIIMRIFLLHMMCRQMHQQCYTYMGAEKSLARPGRKQATATKL